MPARSYRCVVARAARHPAGNGMGEAEIPVRQSKQRAKPISGGKTAFTPDRADGSLTGDITQFSHLDKASLRQMLTSYHRLLFQQLRRAIDLPLHLTAYQPCHIKNKSDNQPRRRLQYAEKPISGEKPVSLYLRRIWVCGEKALAESVLYQ